MDSLDDKSEMNDDRESEIVDDDNETASSNSEKNDSILGPSLLSTVFADKTKSLLDALVQSIVDGQHLASSVAAAFDSIIKGYRVFWEQLDFNAITSAVELFQKRISEYVASIHIPSFSDERKQELLEAHRKWGEFGWTYHPNDEFEKLFNDLPVDKRDADRIALKKCKDVESLFQAIHAQKRVKKTDLDEAIADFKSKRYKSCAMMLFSLIDAQLIRFQRKKETKGKRREVGKNAVEKARERIGVDKHEEWLFLALFYANLFACLGKVFEGGKDFKAQPGIINRNYLDHGMMTKPARRKDCLQLFLLYYNMLEMLNLEYDTGK